MTLNIEKEYQELIPPLSVDEFAQLESNILSDGCRDSIVTWEETIIDGHNRYAICKKHGIDFKIITMEFADRSHAREWIIRNQFGRRNLPPYVRVELALELESTIAARSKQGERTDLLQKSEKSEPLNSTKEIASIAGVSHDTVAKVKTIKALASDETKDKLAKGEISINKAYQETKEPPTTVFNGAKFPLPKYEISNESKEKAEQAAKDSETLWLLKSTWKKANKKEKADFEKWLKSNQ
jgi:ParB-like chromosome segregation protein Spo0J